MWASFSACLRAAPEVFLVHRDTLGEAVGCRLDPGSRGHVGELVNDHGSAIDAVVLLPLWQVDVGVRAELEAGRSAHLAELDVGQLLGLLAGGDRGFPRTSRHPRRGCGVPTRPRIAWPRG